MIRLASDRGAEYRRVAPHDALTCDEMHSFIGVREQNKRPDHAAELGEPWLWLGIASTAKLIISYRVAPTRDEQDAEALIKDLRGQLTTIPVINTGGLLSHEDTFRAPPTQGRRCSSR